MKPGMFAAAVLFTALSGSAIAQTPAEAPIFGSELMTQQERLEYRDRMRAARTQEEREQIRNQHHEKMQVRAKERGSTLPAMPPMPGGMGPGGGQGPGVPKR
ncbi:MAG: hypothetical protein QUV35_06880 [Hydrogenophaga sp.]|uniref:hypothetical protein n=1 Tax=Hydrogenophaga sp. TaxID=1904254 RepID=UPI0026367859|nr:hypothetical protein [Hydrogenophaga sp.]MDM7942335.1 hypothetical protein [Hydrogenophaga sp.]